MLSSLFQPQLRPKSAQTERLSRPTPREHTAPGALSVEDFVDLFGDASTSALTLYEGYLYFKWRQGEQEALVAYVDTGRAWVAASDPLGPSAMRAAALDAFFSAAKAASKTAISLPIDSRTAQAARAQGARVIQIGSEPWFRIQDFDFARYRRRISVAARLMARRPELQALLPASIDSETRAEIDTLISKWVGSRSSAPFEFLNRVEPWSQPDYKRYFRLRFQGKTHAFLAAVQIPARNAWYLVDLVRSPCSAVGATELLVGYAMECLKQEGASEVTLGLCPLARIESRESPVFPRLYRAMKWTYQNSSTFYGFRSLTEYRDKLGPTRWEPKYLVTREKSWLAITRAFLCAIYPQGIRITLADIIRRQLSRAAQKSFAAAGIKLEWGATSLQKRIVSSLRRKLTDNR